MPWRKASRKGAASYQGSVGARLFTLADAKSGTRLSYGYTMSVVGWLSENAESTYGSITYAHWYWQSSGCSKDRVIWGTLSPLVLPGSSKPTASTPKELPSLWTT
jgi:uncharacterized membrane protein